MMDDAEKNSSGAEIKVGVELTPNPNSLKFIVSKTLLPLGTVYFSDREKAEGSPLAEALFKIDSVQEILIGTDFITLTKKEEAEWEPIVPDIFHAMKNQLQQGGILVREDLLPKPSEKSASEIEQRIIDVLDQEIRPAVARDGGDILFGGYEDGVVKLFLQGACSSCPSSIMTLKMGVENRLKQLIPEIREVVQV